MAGISRFNTFACPNCNAFYQVVKVEAGPETKDHQITCRVCSSPLSGREGKLVLKYFLLREAVRRKTPWCVESYLTSLYPLFISTTFRSWAVWCLGYPTSARIDLE